MIEIKETAEERRNGKSKAADEKRNVNDRFVSIFYRNSDPTTDPPRTEFLWQQNPSLNKVKKIRFRDDRHMITSERKLAVGVDGRDDRSNGALPLPLGKIGRAHV